MTKLKVGQRLRLLQDIYEPADDFSPAGYLAKDGHILVVRKLNPDSKFSIAQVSHEHIKDRTFSLRDDDKFEVLPE